MVRGVRRAENVNGYNLGVSYIPSHRHESLRTKASLVQNQTYMSIHNYKPAIVKYTEKGEAKADSITTIKKYCRKPKVPATVRESMKAHWGGILAKRTFESFTLTEFKRHGQHHKYKTDAEYFEQGYKHGRKYLKGGRHDLMRIMRRRGYKPGYRYHCRSFVRALQEELRHPVLVEFKYSAENVKYLDEISSLYHLNSKRNMARREQIYDEIKYFHLEDFSRILKGTRLIECSKKLMSMRFGLWGRKRIF